MFYVVQVVAAPSVQVESVVPLTAGNELQHHIATGSALSFLDLLLQADTVIKVVMVLLLLASISTWAIVINKLTLFARMRFVMHRFEKVFWSGKSLDVLYRQVIQSREKHPLAEVFMAAMNELDISDGKNYSKQGIRERMQQSIQLASSRALHVLEGGIAFLATAASSAPFVGLFGTVWGIMSSFQSIATSKNTALAVVAPGIAEALLVTAIGLLVAIPASIFYNKLSNDISKFILKTENFSIELIILISRDLEDK